MKMLITILENRIEESRRVINYLKEQIKVLEEIDLILKEYDEASPDYRRNNQQLIEKVAELSGEEKELDECQNALANTKKELAGQRLFFEKQSKSESDDCKGMESSLAMRMIG